MVKFKKLFEGHCGITNDDGSINNKKSLERIVEVAVSHVIAGANVIFKLL